MEVKEEYIAVTSNRYGSNTYCYDYEFNPRTNKYKKIGGFSYIPYFRRFATKELAQDYLNKLISAGVCNPYKVYVDTPINGIPKIMWSEETQYKEVAFIIRVPEEFYLGKEWCNTLKYMGDTRYSDDKPYQLYGHAESDLFAKDKWLVYNSPDDFHWVDDRFDASFFSEEEIDRVKKIVNDIRAKEIPYKGYVRVSALPLRIEGEKPKFQKGDKAIILGCETISHSLRYPCYEGEISDIKVIRDKNGKKQFVYSSVNNPYITVFLESDYFHTREEITSKGGKFYRGMHNGCPNTELLDYNNRTYVIY